MDWAVCSSWRFFRFFSFSFVDVSMKFVRCCILLNVSSCASDFPGSTARSKFWLLFNIAVMRKVLLLCKPETSKSVFLSRPRYCLSAVISRALQNLYTSANFICRGASRSLRRPLVAMSLRQLCFLRCSFSDEFPCQSQNWRWSMEERWVFFPFFHGSFAGCSRSAERSEQRCIYTEIRYSSTGWWMAQSVSIGFRGQNRSNVSLFNAVFLIFFAKLTSLCSMLCWWKRRFR